MADTEQTIDEHIERECNPPDDHSPDVQAPGEDPALAAADEEGQDRSALVEDGHQTADEEGEDRSALVEDGHQTAGEEGEDPSALVEDGHQTAGEEGEDPSALVAERDQYLALAQRTQADFENYRKRAAREAGAARERGVAMLAKELLPALDNLDRGLREAQSASECDGRDDQLLAGLRLVRSELSDALGRVGIESFSPAGEPFDPALHEAMAQKAVEDVPSETVVEVYQPGYRLGATILRAARVVVAA